MADGQCAFMAKTTELSENTLYLSSPSVTQTQALISEELTAWILHTSRQHIRRREAAYLHARAVHTICNAHVYEKQTMIHQSITNAITCGQARSPCPQRCCGAMRSGPVTHHLEPAEGLAQTARRTEHPATQLAMPSLEKLNRTSVLCMWRDAWDACGGRGVRLLPLRVRGRTFGRA